MLDGDYEVTEESMMWVDIGVTVLLTLRIIMFRIKLHHLPDSRNDITMLVDDESECLSCRDENVDGLSPISDSVYRNTGSYAITYSCNDKVER